MSDLQRSFAKAKLAGLPFDPPMPPDAFREEDEDEDGESKDDVWPIPEPTLEDDSSSASSASSASSTGTIRPSLSKHLFARPKGFVGFPLFVVQLHIHHSMCASPNTMKYTLLERDPI